MTTVALAEKTTGAARPSRGANFFDLPEAALRSRRNSKWNSYGPDILPAFVAEMDFSVAEPIREAMLRTIETGDYGYPQYKGVKAELAVAEAFVARMEKRFGWKTETSLVQVAADLVQGTFAPILAFSEPGDGVVLQVPAYPPFREAIATTERELVALTMRDDGARYVFNVEELSGRIGPKTRILIVCNPQNPTGRVFEREELSALARLAIEHDLIVISDEIHSDLVFDGRRHIPLATLGPEIAARTVTITSATKSFNIPGLRCGVMHFGTSELRQRFARRIPSRLIGGCSGLGIDATVAAWTSATPGSTPSSRILRRRATASSRRSGPSCLRCVATRRKEPTSPGSTSASFASTRRAFRFFHDQARIALSAGENFDPACAQFGRLNFATSMPILDRILERLVTAVRNAPPRPAHQGAPL